MKYLAWEGFSGGIWEELLDIQDFIHQNYTPYYGTPSFLAKPTTRTQNLNNKFQELLKQEKIIGGVLSIDTMQTMTITSHSAGYIDKENEIIVGLQTEQPLERGVNPFGGIRMARKACEAYGKTLGQPVEREFRYRKTHNDGVFDAYTPAIRKARHAGLLTGLPDTYGRGRIIGDYRRIALYGIDTLIKEKEKDLKKLENYMDEDIIELREQISMQIKALGEIKILAQSYGKDISKPA